MITEPPREAMLRCRGIRRLRVHHVVMQQKHCIKVTILAICVVRVEELRFAWLVGGPRNMKSRRKSCMSEVVGARSSMWPRVQARSRLSARVQESCQHGRARDRATEHVMPAPSVKMMCSKLSCITVSDHRAAARSYASRSRDSAASRASRCYAAAV